MSRCRKNGTSAYIRNGHCVVLERVVDLRRSQGDRYVKRNQLVEEAIDEWLERHYPNAAYQVPSETTPKEEQ